MAVLVAAGVLALNLVVWGCHALLPFRLAAGPERERRLWALAALPALGLSALATLVALRLAPDAAVVWGLSGFLDGSLAARLIGIALAALALADLLLLLGRERFGAAEWQLAGAFGAIGLAAATYGSELLRIGWGPVPARWALLAAAALRLPLALAAAELAAGAPRLWTRLAGPALALAVLLWPSTLRGALDADLLTLAAALVVLTAAASLPASLRRAAGWAGLALAVLFLVRAADVSAILGGGDQLPIDLLAP